MNSKIQITIVGVGAVSLALGIKTLLQTPTLILSQLTLVGVYVPILFVIGLVLKNVFRKDWHLLTYSSMVVSVICLAFFFSQHRGTERVVLPDEYSGKVYLILSNETTNDFSINEYGVGYLSEHSYEKGFMPKIIQKGEDISNQMTRQSSGSTSFRFENNSYSIRYVSFFVGRLGKGYELKELVEIDAIDINRIKR